jgi:hypothetical protein
MWWCKRRAATWVNWLQPRTRTLRYTGEAVVGQLHGPGLHGGYLEPVKEPETLTLALIWPPRVWKLCRFL